MDIDNNNEPLAFRYWPLEDKTIYCENDLDSEEKVEKIFDYAQILEVSISKSGWKYLIHHYGFGKLFEINNRSGWFDCETIEDFKSWVEYEMNLSN